MLVKVNNSLHNYMFLVNLLIMLIFSEAAYLRKVPQVGALKRASELKCGRSTEGLGQRVEVGFRTLFQP